MTIRDAEGADRNERVREALERVRARCDVEARFANDPIEFVHRYDDPHDREIVALVASSLAFGNVKAFRAKIADALARLGPDVAAAASDTKRVRRVLRGWKHRVYKAADLAGLVVGARKVQLAHGSLGAALGSDFEESDDLREALVRWTSRIRKEGGLDKGSRGASHLLADPSKGSASKRLLLLLRWMARPADGIDLGVWSIPPSRLLMPVDVHIHKLGRNLGFTDRNQASWKTAEDITRALARFDPHDPVKYDFALCHLGMLQRCPSRRDPKRCEGCGIQSVCRHWALPSPTKTLSSTKTPKKGGAGKRDSRSGSA